MSILYLVIPLSILICLIVFLAIAFLIGDGDESETSTKPIIVRHRGIVIHVETTTSKSVEPYENYNLHWLTQRIHYLYWKADKKVRDILKAKGWNWS